MPNRIVNLANFAQFTAINLLSDPGYDKADRIIPQAVQIVLDWALSDGKAAHNVMYGQVTGTVTVNQALANSLHNAITGGAFGAFAGHLASSTSFVGVTVRDMRAANLPAFQSSVGSTPGTGLAIALPNEVALVVTLRTAKSGRSFRGRLFIPGYALAESIAGNVASPGAVTDTNSWFTSQVSSAIASSGMTPCLGLFHRLAYTSAGGRPVPERPATTQPITAYVVRDNHWDTQRRRGLK
jgi:hypothetical protein